MRALAPQPLLGAAALRSGAAQCSARRGALHAAAPRRASRAPAPRRVAAAADGGVSMTEAQKSEAAGYKKRAEESAAAGVLPSQRPPAGGDPPPPGNWSWTLNWDYVLHTDAGAVEVIVGSCPKCAADVHRIADESPATAILCLQSDDCLTALGVDLPAVRAAAGARGLLWTRVAVRDFDRLDQAAMLPDMARALTTLLALGRVPYVHCTAGINRAPLSVVGMLTFARGWELDAAVAALKQARPQANPYVEPWKAARARLLAGREEECYSRVHAAGGASAAQGGDWIARDWGAAQRKVLTEAFNRAAQADVDLVRGALAAAGAPAAQQSGGRAKEDEGENLVGSVI